MTHVSPSVLIVEDDPLIALDLHDRVLELGCRVVGPAYGLAEGCAAAEKGSFDFALLDFDLGRGNNSLPIAERLGERGIGYAFITSSDLASIAAMLPRARIFAKPVRQDDLTRLIGQN